MGPLDRDVGAKIRAFRRRKKLSLNELSRLTGIAASNLSSMELGKSSPTLSTLVKIAEAFGVKAGVFLDEALYRKTVLCGRSDAEVREPAPDTQAWVLTQGVWLNRLHVEILEIRAGGKLPLQPEGRDRFLYCLQGALTARAEDEAYFLREGDGLYVMPEAPMLLENESGAKGSVLVVWLKAEDS